MTLGMQASVFSARIKWQGCGRKSIPRKNGGNGGGSLISPDGVAPRWMVGVCLLSSSLAPQKSRKRFSGTSSPG